MARGPTHIGASVALQVRPPDSGGGEGGEGGDGGGGGDSDDPLTIVNWAEEIL